jgi:hypothetical protein
MATRNEWLALAERCEKATASDREMDAAIMFDAFAVPVGQMSDGGPRGYLWPSDNPSWSFGIRFPGKDRDWFAKQRQGDEKETLLIERDGALVLMNDLRVPALTASLDAITALIGREFPQFELSISVGAKNCSVGLYAPGLGRGVGVAGTEALARSAAFCRAMADGIRAKE